MMIFNKFARSVHVQKLFFSGLLMVFTQSANIAHSKSLNQDDLDIIRAAAALGLQITHTQHAQYKKPFQRHTNNQRQANKSIWYRVLRGFRLRNDQYRPRVRQVIKSFQRNPARLHRVLNRSSDYLYFVMSELQKRNMPSDLVLLPMVESAYQNKAVSHAGAVGMWQFIPETGRRYGLKQTHGYDGRMDVIESTRAALDYLQKLHREFGGDWLLALAAYNSGEQRVHREIQKNRKRGLPTDYWNLSLPKETRNYVPYLLAYREVLRQPHKFGIRLPSVMNAPVLVPAHVNKAVDLRKVAHLAGVHPGILMGLNPGFKYGIIMPRLARKIILPRKHAGNLLRAIKTAPTVNENLVRQYAKATTNKRRSRRHHKRVIHHRVRSGENLSVIASRYGTTVKKLMRLNRMRSAHIKVGKRLRVAVRRHKRSSSS